VIGFSLSLLAWLFYFNDGLFAVVYTVRCSFHFAVAYGPPAHMAKIGLATSDAREGGGARVVHCSWATWWHLAGTHRCCCFMSDRSLTRTPLTRWTKSRGREEARLVFGEGSSEL